MSLKDELIASASIPTGKSKFGTRKIDIRGLTTAEDIQFAEDGFLKNIIPLCAACIVDEGEPVFTEKELTAAAAKMKAGILKPILMDILQISFPDTGKTTKN